MQTVHHHFLRFSLRDQQFDLVLLPAATFPFFPLYLSLLHAFVSMAQCQPSELFMMELPTDSGLYVQLTGTF